MTTGKLAVAALSLVIGSTGRAADPPTAFYTSLVGGIASLKGNVVVNVSGGRWKTTLAGSTVIWEVEDDTVATASVSYVQGTLEEASLEFKPPVHVWAVGAAKNVSGRLGRVAYNQNGDVVSWDLTQDHDKAVDLSSTPKLKRHLEFPRRASDLFLGKPFAAAAGSFRCPDDGKSVDCRAARPMITRVRVYSRGPDQPGLYVGLKDNYTLYLSRAEKPGQFENYLTVLQPSSIELDNVDYDVESKTIRGTLKNLSVLLQNGRICSSDAVIKLRQGTQVRFSNVEFSRDEAGKAVVAAQGALEGAIAQGSEFTLLRRGEDLSKIVVDSGSVSLVGVELAFDGAGQAAITVGNGSNIQAAVLASRLTFGSGNVVTVQSGTVVADVSYAAWVSGARPNVTGTLSAQVSLSGGTLDLLGTGALKLLGGGLSATGLTFNSLKPPYVIGRFADLYVDLADHSTVEVPGGLHFDGAAGGSVRANDADAPFELAVDSAVPLGLLRVALPFHALRSTKGGTFGLFDGRASLVLNSKRGGVVEGTDIDLSGILAFDLDGTSAKAPVTINQGKLLVAPGKPTTFNGVLSASLSPGPGVRVVTPFQKGSGDVRVFPISFDVALADAVALKNVPISFSGTNVNFATSATLALNVHVLAGGGEHANYDEPYQGFSKDQNDSSRNNQELFTDTYASPATCRFHLYLKEATYRLPVNANVVFADGALDLKLDATAIPTVAWDSDGCAVEKFLGDVLSAIANLVGIGPDHLRHGVDGVIEWLIRRTLESKASKSWHIALPPIAPSV